MQVGEDEAYLDGNGIAQGSSMKYGTAVPKNVGHDWFLETIQKQIV